MPDKNKTDLAAAVAALEGKVGELESSLHWTKKRLLYWERFIWQLCDILPQDSFPLKELIGTFLKDTKSIELQMISDISKEYELEIVNLKTGKKTCRELGKDLSCYRERLERLESMEIDEIVREYREECADALWGLFRGELGSQFD